MYDKIYVVPRFKYLRVREYTTFKCEQILQYAIIYEYVLNSILYCSYIKYDIA